MVSVCRYGAWRACGEKGMLVVTGCDLKSLGYSMPSRLSDAPTKDLFFS